EGYVNDYGYVTADCLSNYVFDRMLQEPNRPQIPIRKLEASGDLIVAHHPHLSKHEIDQVNSSYSSTASFVSNSAEINMKMMEAERYERNNDYDSAVSCYLEAIALDPNDYRPYNWKGDVLFKIEKNEEALKAYDGAITARPEHPDAYHRKGRVYFKLGDYDKALEYYDRASKIRPRSSEFLKDIGLALYELKEYEQAIKYFNQTLNLKPNQNEISEFKNLAARNLTETNELKKGMMLFDSGKYEDAIICFSKVLEINSNNIQTMRFKGLAMVKLSHFDEAISCFDEALKKDPTNNEIAKAKELAYEEQRQRKIPLLISNGSQYNKDNYCQNAIDSIEKTIKLGLENQSESNYKRNALYYLSKSKEPVASNTKGLTINPDDIHITNDEKCATRKLDKIGGPVSQDPTLPSWYHDKYSGSNSIIYQDHTSSLTSKLQKGGQIIHKLQKGGQIIHILKR
ncbi:MAG TPA: tetratricopeptide repeat protein, partial [Nitrososphaeraceae archaeon]